MKRVTVIWATLSVFMAVNLGSCNFQNSNAPQPLQTQTADLPSTDQTQIRSLIHEWFDFRDELLLQGSANKVSRTQTQMERIRARDIIHDFDIWVRVQDLTNGPVVKVTEATTEILDEENIGIRRLDAETLEVSLKVNESQMETAIDPQTGEYKTPSRSGSGGAPYIFTFKKANGAYMIHEVKSNSLPDIWETVGQLRDLTQDEVYLDLVRRSRIMDVDNPALNPKPKESSKSLFKTQSLRYDGAAAAAYARAWAKSRNPAYVGYASDCTNFVSQALTAGGWEEAGYAWQVWLRDSLYRWYYSTGTPFPWSNTWGAAASFGKFAIGTGRTSAVYHITGLDLGDIVQYDNDKDGLMDHTMIVTQTPWSSPAKEYMLSYHTNDELDKPFRDIVTSGRRFLFHKVVSTVNLLDD
ncbi:MAG: amidase domain-containing protein [Deinococcaceae bacterium]